MGLFNFNFYPEGKGVRKDEKQPPLVRFFQIYTTKFFHLARTALYYTGTALVCFLLSWLLFKLSSAAFFPLDEGVDAMQSLAITAATAVSNNNIMAWLVLIITALPFVLLYLPLLGMTFIARNCVREKAYFLDHDMLRIAKENWLIGLKLSFLSYLVSAVSVVGIFYYFNIAGDNWIYYIPMLVLCELFITVIVISFYAWIMAITYNVSVSQTIKYSLLLALKNLPKTGIMLAVELLLTALTVLLAYGAYKGIGHFGLVAAVLFIALFVFVPFCVYLRAFIAWPIIEKLQKNDDSDEQESESDENTDVFPVDNETAQEESLAASEISDDIEAENEMVFYNGRMVRRDEIEY